LRTILSERLDARREEMEQTILTRVYAVSDPTEAGDSEYVAGLKAAVTAAIDYGLAGIQTGRSDPSPIPLELFAQARQAARGGVSLDTVLRRYFAGYALLGDFVMQEAEASNQFGVEDLHILGRAQSTLFDRVVEMVSAEYNCAVEAERPPCEQRREKCVQRLLAGELVDPGELNYDLGAWHLGAIVAGPGAEEAVRDLAQHLDRRLFLLTRGEGTIWAWLGGYRRLDRDDLLKISSADQSVRFSLALGEPGRGLTGWRLTHQQAAAALPIALRRPGRPIRYGDVNLLASALQDEVLMRSLSNLYLSPLAEERDGGEALRQTLRAYFTAEGNVSSTAASLSVSRQTVTSRLRLVELRIGRKINTCSASLEAALSLQRLGLVVDP
jgi:hypothetical protein